MNDDHPTIFTAIARTLWVCAWSDVAEEYSNATDTDLPWGPGAELMDVAPDTPHAALCEAYRFVGALEHANGMNVHALVWRVLGEDPDDSDVATLGHYLAMEAQGHGVSWQDDHDPHELTVPSMETPHDLAFGYFPDFDADRVDAP